MIHETAVIYPGTVIGEGVEIQAGAVLGKPPKLAKRSTAAGGALEPLAIGAGSVDLLPGDRLRGRAARRGRDRRRPGLRARARDDRRRAASIGRGSTVDNDTAIGARVKIQTQVYVTAYMTSRTTSSSGRA